MNTEITAGRGGACLQSQHSEAEEKGLQVVQQQLLLDSKTASKNKTKQKLLHTILMLMLLALFMS